MTARTSSSSTTSPRWWKKTRKSRPKPKKRRRPRKRRRKKRRLEAPATGGATKADFSPRTRARLAAKVRRAGRWGGEPARVFAPSGIGFADARGLEEGNARDVNARGAPQMGRFLGSWTRTSKRGGRPRRAVVCVHARREKVAPAEPRDVAFLAWRGMHAHDGPTLF